MLWINDDILARGALVFDGRRFMKLNFAIEVKSSNELGRLLLKMTPLCKESASSGSGRLPFIQGRTRHNVPLPLPVNTPLAHWRAQKTCNQAWEGQCMLGLK